MTEHALKRPSELRKAVAEWAAMGLSVKVDPDGTIYVHPVERPPSYEADLIDWKRR